MNIPARLNEYLPAITTATLPSVRGAETDARRDMLRILGATLGPPLVPYGDHVIHCRKENVMHFGTLEGGHYYIPADISLETLREAARRIKPVQTKDGIERNMLSLGRLFTLTASQKRSQDQEEHLLNTYLHQLRHYPPHAVEYVLSNLADTTKFFPTWADIASPLNQLAGWRYVYFTKLATLAQQIKQKGYDNGA